MAIKHIITVTICSLSLLSCGMGDSGNKSKGGCSIAHDRTSNSATDKIDSAMLFNLMDSLRIDPSLGEIMERRFQGVVPTASGLGVEYTLFLYNQKFSGDGVYTLATRYIKAPKGQDVVEISHGRQYTLRGDATDTDAVVYQLLCFESADPINLLLLTDGSLEMLNLEFERAASKIDYTLKLQ